MNRIRKKSVKPIIFFYSSKMLYIQKLVSPNLHNGSELSNKAKKRFPSITQFLKNPIFPVFLCFSFSISTQRFWQKRINHPFLHEYRSSTSGIIILENSCLPGGAPIPVYKGCSSNHFSWQSLRHEAVPAQCVSCHHCSM